jgi:hypothetical protein
VGLALTFSAQLFDWLGEPGESMKRVEEIDRVGRENSLPFLIERPGWEERQYYAEALRVKGWLLSLKGDSQGAEGAYIASLDWARTQQAKSWELRTATSYARLMRDQGRVGDARDLLTPVYRWFTEGFATKDLKEAKALLSELTGAGDCRFLFVYSLR